MVYAYRYITSVLTLTFDVYVRINALMPSVHKMVKHTLKLLQQNYRVLDFFQTLRIIDLM